MSGQLFSKGVVAIIQGGPNDGVEVTVVGLPGPANGNMYRVSRNDGGGFMSVDPECLRAHEGAVAE